MVRPVIVPLAGANIPAAAVALTQAFEQDPLQRYMFPAPEDLREKSPAHFAAVLQYGLRFGEVFTNAGTPQCAAVWLKPNEWQVTPERLAAAGLDALPGILDSEASERFFSVMACVESYHFRDVPPDHWYLLLLGVAPTAQGQGLARALVQPILDRAAAADQACYLETAQPANVSFYEHLGFRTMVEQVEPRSGIRLWTFRRDPPSRVLFQEQARFPVN